MMKIDIETSVAYVENSINGMSSGGFFVTTEFGKIGIELWSKDLGPFSEVIVDRWENAPDTKWAMKHRHSNCDFHVLIEKAKTKFSTHLRVIEAMSQCMLMYIFNMEMTQDIIDAATKIYLVDIEAKQPTINAMAREYSSNKLGVIARNDPDVISMVRELVVLKDTRATSIVEKGRQLSAVCHNGWIPSMIHKFREGYQRDIMYLILYIADLTSRPITLYFDLEDRIIDVSPYDIIDIPNHIARQNKDFMAILSERA